MLWSQGCFLEKIAPRARMAFLREIPKILHETIATYYVMPEQYYYE
jgi:hypothetical protein